MPQRPSAARPWNPAQATAKIRAIAASEAMVLGLTAHAKIRMAERGLILSDLLHVLRNGFVYDPAEFEAMNNSYKYRIEGRSPNSNSRSLRVVVVPDPAKLQLTIVTIMWRDKS